MQHWVTYPLVRHPPSAELMRGDAIVRFARAAEDAGFGGIAFTDHPAPSHKWLDAGGHDTLDPFAVLAFVAAATSRIRLIPNIVVLPYRNPVLVAKSTATIDAVSGGRFVLSVATGYLRGEYRALGVDFEERNALFDDAPEVLRGVCTEDEFSYEGHGFTAKAVTVNPKPANVPIWIGGNSARTRQRVALPAPGRDCHHLTHWRLRETLPLTLDRVQNQPHSGIVPVTHADLLRTHGVQVTAQRVAVLRAVSASPHVTADAVAEAARTEIGSISRQAVYDALALLADKGIIRRIQPAFSSTRYEDRVGDNHHHLICRDCGQVVDVDCAVGHAPCLDVADDSDYEIDEAEVIYWGRCPDCLGSPLSPNGAGEETA